MRSNRHFQIAVMVVIGLFFVFSQTAYAEDPPPEQEQMYTYGGCVELVDDLRSQLETPAPVPKTGQISCFACCDDDHWFIIPCPGTTGQDGDLKMGVEWPDPRFTDNGDGTITDNLTGLMWLTDANCMKSNCPDFDEDGDADGLVTWQHALDFVAGINTGDCEACRSDEGYTDWRLPNIRELHSLVDFGNFNPALPDEHPFENVPVYPSSQSSYYWSSTTLTHFNDAAWTVQMLVGDALIDNSKDSYRYYVWPVRGGNW